MQASGSRRRVARRYLVRMRRGVDDLGTAINT